MPDQPSPEQRAQAEMPLRNYASGPVIVIMTKLSLGGVDATTEKFGKRGEIF
jgi:predicted aconitase with swiveling domain